MQMKEGLYMNSCLFSDDCREMLLDKLLEGDCGDASLQTFSEELIEFRDSIPRLYRFSPADYNNIRALETRTLFLSPIGAMNDIFEGLSGCVTEETLEQFEQLGELAYLKCFSENRCNLRMWSQYADNYSGMCIAYDFSKAPELLLRHLFPVIYKKDRFSYHLQNYDPEKLAGLKRDLEECNAICDENSVSDVMAAFLVKSDDWKEECEWRILYTYSQLYLSAENVGKENGFYHELVQKHEGNLYTKGELQRIPAPMITDVYLGPKMAKHIKEHIKAIVQGSDIQLHELHLDKEHYRLIERPKYTDEKE